MGTQERSHHLEWVAESITPITNFKLQYKEDYYHHPNAIEDDSSSWTEIQVNPQNNGDHFYSGKLTLDKLTPATRYLARVSSKNDYGYSELSQPFKFATKGGKKMHSFFSNYSANSKADKNRSKQIRRGDLFQDLIVIKIEMHSFKFRNFSVFNLV